MNNSTMRFIIEALGADRAAAEIDKIDAAAKKAGMSFKKYLNTSAGSSQLVQLQKEAAIAHVQNAEAAKANAEATKQQSAAVDRASRSQAGYFGHIARTTVQSALINKLFLEFVDVSGQAIQQVDLMNNFPATMRSMGESTADANEAFQSLRDYVGQVGGNLGDATSYVTRFTGATKDVKAATAIFVGLNNALIAGDSSLEEQRQAAVQFAQALERGKPDMREWRTLTQNMSFQLDQVAKSMGYVNANELGEALTEGEESMAAFTTALTKMATGTGPIAEQARARMSGMQFSFNVLKNTMVQGLAAIIQTIGRENIVSFFQFLTQVVQVLTSVVIKLIGALVSLFNFFAGLFNLPTIKLKKDTAAVADNLNTGSKNADDLGEGLKDANGEAKKLNKSLASFDKMNVLPDKESGSGKDKDEGGGGPGFDAGQIGKLGDVFGDIDGKLQEAGKWAKIFAGVLVGLAGIKFAQAIIDQVDGVAQSFSKAKGGLDKFKNAIVGTTDDSGKKVGGLGEKIKNLPTVITTGFSGLKGQAASLGKFLTNPYVLVAAAIAAVVAGIVYLYNTNEWFKKGWESVWNFVGDIVKKVADIIGKIFSPVIDNLKKAWDKLVDALQPIILKFKELYDIIFPGVGGMELLGKVLGTIAAIIAGVVIAPFALLAAAIGGVVYAFIWLGTKAIEIITSIVEFVNRNFGGVKDAMVDLVKNGIEWMGNRFEDVVNGIKAVWNGLEDFFRPIVGFFQDVFTKAKDAIIAVWNTLTDPIQEQFTKLKESWGEFTNALEEPMNKIKETWNTVTSAIGKVWDEQMTKLSDAWDKFYTKIEPGITAIQKLFDKIKESVDKAVATIKKKFDEFKTAIQPLIDAVGKFYDEKIKPLIQGIKDWMVENEVAKKALQAIGIVIAVVVLAPLALLIAAIALVVAAFAALAFGILWVVTKFVEFGTYLVGGGLWEDIQEVIRATGQWIQDKFNEAIEFVKSIFSTIGAWFQERWDEVVAVFSVVGTWFKEKFQEAWDGVKLIWGVLGDWFKERWENLKTNLATIGTWFKEKFQEAWNGVVAIWTGVGTWFSDRWTDIKNAFNNVKQWLSDKFTDAWNGIKGVFGGVSDWFRINVIDKIVNTFSGIKDRITGFFSGVWDGLSKGLKDALNSILKLPLTIPSVTIAGKTIGGQTLIPRLARGGIVEQATLAVVGEQGGEAIVPLENNTEWIDKLAAKINTSTSGGSKQPIQLVVQIGEDKIASQIIDLINEKTHMSGRNTIYV